MALTLCPCGENAPMQPVHRHGVEIDICTKCRGVWLDRGELEKLLDLSRGGSEPEVPRPPVAPQPQPQTYAPPQGYAQPHPGYRHDDDDDYKKDYYKKKKKFDMFDFFD